MARKLTDHRCLRRAVIVVQHSARSLASLNRSVVAGQIDLGNNQLVAESLMIPLQMIMRHELADRVRSKNSARLHEMRLEEQ